MESSFCGRTFVRISGSCEAAISAGRISLGVRRSNRRSSVFSRGWARAGGQARPSVGHRVESSSGLGERLLLLSSPAGSQTDGRTKVWEARRRLLGVSLCFLRSVSIRRPFGRSPCRSSRSSRRTEATQSQSTAIKCSMIYGPSVDSGTCPLQ